VFSGQVDTGEAIDQLRIAQPGGTQGDLCQAAGIDPKATLIPLLDYLHVAGILPGCKRLLYCI